MIFYIYKKVAILLNFNFTPLNFFFKINKLNIKNFFKIAIAQHKTIKKKSSS